MTKIKYFVIQRTLIINLPHHIILESITHQPGHSHLRFSLEINTSIENSAAALIHQSNSRRIKRHNFQITNSLQCQCNYPGTDPDCKFYIDHIS